MSTQGDRDELLDAYLEGASPLSRAYREQATEEPPAHLDRRIRLAARRRARSHGPFARSWTVPASLAAVLMLSVSVVVLMAPPDAQDPSLRDLPAPPATPRARGEDAGSRAPAVESVPDDARGAARARDAENAEPPAAGMLERGEIPPPAPATSTTLAPPPAPPREPAAAPAEPPRRPAAEERMQKRSRDEVQQSAPAAPQGAASGFAPMPERAAEKAGAVLGDDLGGDPEAWLQAIEALLARGDVAAAREELAAFLARYPEHPLGQRLQALREAAPGLERSDKPQ